jgi:uncharacterized membrane protein YgcG
MRINILKILLFTLIIGLPLWVNAGYEIEVTLPGGPAAGEEVDLASYINYIYQALLGMVGLAAFGALVVGGFQYMLSDSVTSKDEAKKWIWGAIGGLLLGLSAFLILYTINPDLTEISPPSLDPISAPSGSSGDSGGGDSSGGDSGGGDSGGGDSDSGDIGSGPSTGGSGSGF